MLRKETVISAAIATALTLSSGLSSSLASGLASGLAASPAAKPSACNQESLHCFYSARGVVISNRTEAGNELDVMEEAAKRYERHFGFRPVPAAIITGDAVDTVDVTQLVMEDGYSATLPWLSTADKMRLARYSIKQQIQQQMPEISEENLEKSVEASLAATAQQHSGDSDTEDGALAHELSHLWFISGYWPGFFGLSHQEAAYGGPGPDWLDEMAAVLAENDKLTESRWHHFQEMSFADDENNFYPLAEFFVMDHPMAASEAVMHARQKQAEAGENKVEIQALVITQDELEAQEGRNPTIFYTQSRLFADFMIETTKNDRIFADITAHIVAGGTVDSWLSSLKGKYTLPATIKSLEAQWQAWIGTHRAA